MCQSWELPSLVSSASNAANNGRLPTGRLPFGSISSDPQGNAGSIMFPFSLVSICDTLRVSVSAVDSTVCVSAGAATVVLSVSVSASFPDGVQAGRRLRSRIRLSNKTQYRLILICFLRTKAVGAGNAEFPSPDRLSVLNFRR